MEKISKIITKKVISLENAQQVGYVVDMVFDDEVKNFTGLIIIDDESENSFILRREDIYSMGEETVMIKTADTLQFNISSKSNNPIGKTVYDSYGNCLGRVIDVEIQGKTVKKVMTTFCEFSQRYIRKSGDNFLIFGTFKKEKKSKSFKDEVSIVEHSTLPTVAITQVSDEKLEKLELPTRIYLNTKSLLGQVVTEDILGYNNELIAKKNDVINTKIINKAKLHNKLIILKYYSK